jgi:hypothetical protein
MDWPTFLAYLTRKSPPILVRGAGLSRARLRRSDQGCHWLRCGRHPIGSAASALKVMIPTLLPALERHGRLALGNGKRAHVLDVDTATTIDRLLIDTKVAASGGRRRRIGFYSAIRREVPIRTFNDRKDPPPASERSTWWRTGEHPWLDPSSRR